MGCSIDCTTNEWSSSRAFTRQGILGSGNHGIERGSRIRALSTRRSAVFALLLAAAFAVPGSAAPSEPPPPRPLVASAASPCPTDALLCEDFEDGDFADRGWYDAPRGVVTAAEHAPGSGHAFECTYAQGATGCEGGTPGRHGFDATESLYVSYWVKYGPGFVGSGRPYHPHELVFMTNKDGRYVGPAATHLTTYMEQLAGVPRLGLQDLRNVDTRCILRNDGSFVGCDGNFATFPFTEQRSVAACNGLVGDLDKRDCFPTGAGQWYSSRVWDAPAGTSLFDGEWHRVAALFRMNRIEGGKGVADGALRYWLDGRPVIAYDRILYRTGANADQAFNQLLVAPHIGDGSPRRQTMWIDDLRILRDGDGGPDWEEPTDPAPSPSPQPNWTIRLPFAERGGGMDVVSRLHAEANVVVSSGGDRHGAASERSGLPPPSGRHTPTVH